MTSPTTTVQPRRGPVLARLQGLFPASPTTFNSAPEAVPSSFGRPPPPKALKIRMHTWNMHESLPKGDLEVLLGKVPPYKPPVDPSGFPILPSEDTHPYHIVVIAGQECPSTHGLPMGLGAGFKLIDREKDRDRDGDRDSHHKDDGKDPPHESTGWTAMTEDWLCHGGQRTSITPSQISSPRPLSSSRSELQERKGPYQLLTKERMMGLYLAIYIHRELRPLVKGTSRSVVTAGLIGGRVGNKGGVGISLNLAGTTLLFINAHLAAHEGKVNHRLANFAKIKAELAVDDFLAPDDPRLVAEDLTDKFDYTFLCGDLNFRLDISRLHADWLISRQDYTQALAFDQLRSLMQTGKAFVGFNEAPITFPPTFKFDVLKTIKQKRRTSRLEHWRTAGERTQRLTEVDEHDDEPRPEGIDGEDSDREGDAGDAASLASSTWTSMHSRPGTDGDDDYFQPSPSSHAVSSLSSPGSRVSVAAAANKAKAKWISLLSPASPHSPTAWLRSKHASIGARFSPSPVDGVSVKSKADQHRSLEAPILAPSLKRLSSTKSKTSLPSDDEDERSDDRGVYDSSSKQRVPSWCDRVLWKTTIQPELEDESLDGTASRPRTRVGQFLANALRPLSGRARRGSYSSFVSAASVSTSTTEADTSVTDSSPSSPEVTDQVTPFSRFVERPGRIPRSRSNDTFSVAVKPFPARTLSNDSTGVHPSSSSSHNPPTLSPVRPRRATLSPDALTSLTTAVQHRVTPSRWRFLPAFLSHGSTQSSASHDPSFSGDAMATPKPPRRGEVVCLNYDTLDDRGMRQLEGRSDHRPVIASYAVYI